MNCPGAKLLQFPVIAYDIVCTRCVCDIVAYNIVCDIAGARVCGTLSPEDVYKFRFDPGKASMQQEPLFQELLLDHPTISRQHCRIRYCILQMFCAILPHYVCQL